MALCEEHFQKEWDAASASRAGKPVVITGRVDSCKIVAVIRLEFIRGTGVEADPIRTVIQWWEQEGQMIAEADAWAGASTEGAPANQKKTEPPSGLSAQEAAEGFCGVCGQPKSKFGPLCQAGAHKAFVTKI